MHRTLLHRALAFFLLFILPAPHLMAQDKTHEPPTPKVILLSTRHFAKRQPVMNASALGPNQSAQRSEADTPELREGMIEREIKRVSEEVRYHEERKKRWEDLAAQRTWREDNTIDPAADFNAERHGLQLKRKQQRLEELQAQTAGRKQP